MAKRTYRTASGKMVDIDTLALKNETVIAVGNMNVNARGDKVGKGGKILQSREELIAQHYSVKNNTVPKQNPLPTDSQPLRTRKVVEEDPAGPMDTPAVPDTEIVQDNNQTDNTQQDEWVEDPKTGDFVRSSQIEEEQLQTEEKPNTRGIADALAESASVSVPVEQTEKQKKRNKRGVKRI